MNWKNAIVLSIVACLLNISLTKGQTTTDLTLAKKYFYELDSLAQVDNGILWGTNLYGATMFVLPQNRLIIANQPAKGLKFKDSLYVGILPEAINIANTSVEWNGKSWTMVNWDAISSNDKYSRQKLLIHESWHRIQKDIGILPVMTKNTHLDELQGSILLKLEFLALNHAISDKSDKSKHHLSNALNIRNYRQQMFPDNNENVFELHEGLPEYTGFKLCGIDKTILPKVIAKQLELAIQKDGLANSFPYITGPAYGLLFDKLKNNWLSEVINGFDLLTIGHKIIGTSISTDTATLKKRVSAIISEYKANSLINNETAKFELEKQLANKYENKFLANSVLIIKNNNIQMGFNPQEKIIPITNGVVYKTMRLTGEWGIAEVKSGIFRANDWTYFLLPAPRSRYSGKIIEPDYNLTLNDGWKVVEIKKGKYTLVKN